jgi:hypothetical protein
MDRKKLVFGPLLVLSQVFILGAVPPGAFGQAAAEAGLVSGVSSVSTASAASRLSGATNRALQGHKVAGGTVSRPAATTVVHNRTEPAGSKVAKVSTLSTVSTAGTASGHSGVATPTDHGAKLPDGIAHVWPEDALTQVPLAPQ